MPLSAAAAAVPDVSHCGRGGQRAIDFFFKTPPAVSSSSSSSSPITQEKRDILTYFKRVEIPKDSGQHNGKSSVLSNANDTEDSLLTSEEVNADKSQEVNRKDSFSDISEIHSKNVNTKERTEPANQTNKIIDVINLTNEINEDSEDCLNTESHSLKVQNNSGIVVKNHKDCGESNSNEDEMISSTISINSLSEHEERTNDGNSVPDGGTKLSESRSKQHTVVGGDRTAKAKGKMILPSIVTENKKNAFTFMMANRTKQNEAGKHPTEEEFGNNDQNDDLIIITDSSNRTHQNDKIEIKDPKPSLTKKSQHPNSDTDQINKCTTVNNDLNSSLEDFDLRLCEKPKKKREKISKTSKSDEGEPCMDITEPIDDDLTKHNADEKTSSVITFMDFMKGTSTRTTNNTGDESQCEVLNKNECIKNVQNIESKQKGPTNSDSDDDERPKEEWKMRDSSLGCNDDDAIKTPSSSLKSNDKQDQIDKKDIKETTSSKQVTTKLKRNKAKKTNTMSSDNKEELLMSKSSESSSKRCLKSSVVSNTNTISSFLKKINSREVNEDKSKFVFTVQADVHAPLDGNNKIERKLRSRKPSHTACVAESGGDSSVTKKEVSSSTCDMKKNINNKCKKSMNKMNLEELNKIELSEETTPSKRLLKKPLNKVCIEGKKSETHEQSDQVIEGNFSKVKNKHKATLVSKIGGKVTKRRCVSEKNINKKVTQSAVRRLSTRKYKSDLSEESSDELFPKRKKIKPSQNDNDVTVVSISSSSSSSSSASSGGSSSSSSSGGGGCDGGDKSSSSSNTYKSPKASENKENVAHYTSQLVTQPGKLGLRIKRVHIPKEACRKERIKLKKAYIKSAQLKKVKGSKNLIKRKLQTRIQQKSPQEEASDSTDVTENPLENNNLITLDNDDGDGSGGGSDDGARKNTMEEISKKTTRKRKVTQTLLKALEVKSASIDQLQKSSVHNREIQPQDDRPRRTPRRLSATKINYIEEAIISDDEEEEDKPVKSDKNSKKLVSSKGMKLAPIFCKRPESPGVELVKVIPLSPSKLKARQEFLNSSVSDDVRKQLAVEKSGEDEIVAWPPFPEVSHVQQREDVAPWNIKDAQILLKRDPYSSIENLRFTGDLKVLNKTSPLQESPAFHFPRLELDDIILSLTCMKSKNPNFPVYEIFKAYYDLKKEAVEAYRKELHKEDAVLHLDDDDNDDNDRGSNRKKRKCKPMKKLSLNGRGKRRKLGSGKESVEESVQNPEPIWHERTPHMWTQVFLPKNTQQVIGNTENVQKLKIWLQEWKSKPQIKLKKRKRKTYKKDDDFVVSDESTLDDEEDERVSTYLLSGPPGVGKTAAIYALASELGYKVLEVNASSRRPGRQVMSQLSEATQSHSLSKTSANSNSSSAFSALFSGIMKKENSQAGETSTNDKDLSKMKSLSLVLFEDIDIVFEEWDEGFMSTVNNLMSTTKRPIILTATHVTPNILSQIKESFEVMEFSHPPEHLTVQHLSLIALVNGCHICPEDLECLVHINKGDVRKSILNLQLLTQSGSSYDHCQCTVSQDTLDEKTEEIINEIFPDGKPLTLKKEKDIHFYKIDLNRLVAKSNFNTLTIIPKSHVQYLCNKEDILWKEIENHMNLILPFPKHERQKPLQRYPLQPDDPLLKISYLYSQYESLMSSDDEEKKKAESVIEEPEKKVKPNNPPEIKKTLQSSLEVLSSLYDSLAQLDILSSSQISSHAAAAAARSEDEVWWIKQPVAGLSDDSRFSHPDGTPHNNEDIIQELAKASLDSCVSNVQSTLGEVSAKDWPQLCLLCDTRNETQKGPSSTFNSERERTKKRDRMSRIFDQLPAVIQVSRTAGLDYLSTLRSIAREDELGAAMGKGRRGRRFLSYFLQLGWSVSPEDRLFLANALLNND